jgi:hypothetical protein
MRPKIKPKWNRGTLRKHNALKASKIEMATGFKTRIHGTPKQIGKKFPTGKAPRRRGSKITALRSAYSGAPLEPPMRYGQTILYDPYSGNFEAFDPESGVYQPIVPRYATAEEKALAMARNYVQQAALVGAQKSGGKIVMIGRDNPQPYIMRKNKQAGGYSFTPLKSGGKVSLKDFERASLLVDAATRTAEQSVHAYPEAGFWRDTGRRELNDASNYILSMLQSARETRDPAEQQKWINKGMERIQTLNTALGASATGGKFSAATVGKWLGHSANIAKGYLGRASKFVESASEATGRIAGAQQRIKEAYQRGVNPQAAEAEKLRKAIELSRLKSQLRKYQNINKEYITTGPGSENIATKSWRKTCVPASVASKKIELESLRKRISAYERAGITGGGLNSMKLRAQQLEDEIAAAGGKKHKRVGGKKPSRDKTIYHSYGGLQLAPYSIADSEKANFEKRSKWSSRARTK